MSYTQADNFVEARHRFEEYLHFDRKHPLTFEEWSKLDHDKMAAGLFCNFFDQIQLAWYKVVTNYSYTDDGVDEMLQYLQKNVDKILNHPRRFTPAYIYKVAYNCLFCLCLDPNKHRQKYENEMSNMTASGHNLFDFVKGSKDVELDKDNIRSAMWYEIESLGYDAIAVVNELTIDYKNAEATDWSKYGYRRQWHSRFVTLQKEGKVELILNQLQEVLAKYVDDLGGFELSSKNVIRLSYEAWPNNFKSNSTVQHIEIGDVSPVYNWYRLYRIEYRFERERYFSRIRIVYPDDSAEEELHAYLEDLRSDGLDVTGRVIFLGYYTFEDNNHTEPTVKSTIQDFKRISTEEYNEVRKDEYNSKLSNNI